MLTSESNFVPAILNEFLGYEQTTPGGQQGAGYKVRKTNRASRKLNNEKVRSRSHPANLSSLSQLLYPQNT